jgi:retinol dehydrogenase 12
LKGHHLIKLTGRVHIVTGGYAGIGHQLSKILYGSNATVYIAGRNHEKAAKTIASIKAEHPNSTGKLEFLSVDFSDFNTIKPAVEEFIAKETQLHVLTNNAGISMPPQGSKDAHGNELMLSTNCLGPFIFTTLLLPIIKSTAKASPPDSVRITWASSIAASAFSPTHGLVMENGEVKQIWDDPNAEYAQSKTGNSFLAAECARRYGADGIISASFNPGNLKSELTRHFPRLVEMAVQPLLYQAVFGAYTELYAACSTDITQSNNGCYIAPWGQISTLRDDVDLGLRDEKDGGTGLSREFWEWCEKKTSEFR